jgi:hypothetical protein
VDDELRRTLAGMLSELEDVATRLTARQSNLAKELADVDRDLENVEKARVALSGGTSKPRSERSRIPPEQSRRLQAERLEKMRTWVGERGGGEFYSHEAAEILDVEPMRMGPIMAGFLRRGEVTMREDGGRRVYSLT